MNEQTPIRWRPERALSAAPWSRTPMATAMGRGLAGRCPSCGQTRLFRGYLRVADACAVCAAPLGRVRADDAPPYFTIVIVGHIVVPLMLLSERNYAPSTWLTAAVFLPLSLALSLLLLRPVKGATVGLMLKLGLLKPVDE